VPTISQGQLEAERELASPSPPAAADVVLAYHERTKHRLDRYAAGPETLDWDAQPDPFRRFDGAPRVQLPFDVGGDGVAFGDLYRHGSVPPAPQTLASLGSLLRLSLGLSAWKESGPDRWAVRCAPSSGNLHPTEAYVLASGIAGLDDGLYHYACREHALELRQGAGPAPPCPGSPFLAIGLSSIHWREAWKYGERAFRYCQLDLGHALGALRYGAGVLGWSAHILEGCSGPHLAALLGLDRAGDFAGVEQEEPELLLALTRDRRPPGPPPALDGPWRGRASRLDPHPLYRWPVIDAVAEATRGEPPRRPVWASAHPPLPRTIGPPAAELLQGRRSAQRFDRRHAMRRRDFFQMLDRLLPRASAPWDLWPFEPQLDLVLFVHAVEGIEPGVYALARRDRARPGLQAELGPDLAWRPVETAPNRLPLFQLHAGDCRSVARTVFCRQAIGGDACFAVGMLASLEAQVRQAPAGYRQLHWEAGLIGHVLYLEAESAGLRGTGVGCFFDDALRDLIGLRPGSLEPLYGFTVGAPLDDERISTRPPYPAP
jgi:SagB-type dehydrogenase family enzyme